MKWEARPGSPTGAAGAASPRGDVAEEDVMLSASWTGSPVFPQPTRHRSGVQEETETGETRRMFRAQGDGGSCLLQCFLPPVLNSFLRLWPFC